MCGFNFTVNFNCAAYIPYFPAGYHRGERGNAIVFGLETPDLLAAALLRLEKQPAPVSSIFILLCALIFTRRLAGVIFSDGEMTVGDKSLHSDQLTFAQLCNGKPNRNHNPKAASPSFQPMIQLPSPTSIEPQYRYA